MPPLITLLTDFGTQDSYVGIMKGVMARICPDAQMIDLTHGIPPQDIAAARFNLMSAYLYFPAAAVHVVVVDPGVGSTRRAIAVHTPHGRFVAPDNGVLSGILDRYESRQIQVVELSNPEVWRTPAPSATFHGRDIFAAVAAHWAAGRLTQDLGEPLAVTDLVPFELPALQQSPTEIEGSVQYCDRFGNVVTTIPVEALDEDVWSVVREDGLIELRHTYSDVPPGQPIVLMGSHGWVEIAVNQGSAKDRLGLAVGSPVRMVRAIPLKNCN